MSDERIPERLTEEERQRRLKDAARLLALGALRALQNTPSPVAGQGTPEEHAAAPPGGSACPSSPRRA